MIATNTNEFTRRREYARADMARYVEVIDLVNPQFQRKFIELRLSGYGARDNTFLHANVGGLLKNSPVVCGYNGSINCFVLGNPNIIAPKLLENRPNASSVVLDDSKIWITGGFHTRKTTEFFSLDQETINGPELPITISGHCMVQVDAQTIYIIGGDEGNLVNIGRNLTWKVDPTNNFKMEPGPSLIEGRREHACATMQVNGRIFIVAAGGRKKSSVELLDTSSPEEGWKLGAYHIPMLV